MQRLFLLLFVVAPLLLRAQDLTGVWQGHFRSGPKSFGDLLPDDRYKFEVQIAQNDKKLEAVTYSYLSSIFYGKAAASGTINVKTGKVLIQEGKLLEVRNAGGDVCIMTCFLQYFKSGNDEFLEGKYISMNVRDSSNCGRGTVFLHKVASSDFYEEPFLIERKNELKKEELAKERPDVKAAPLHRPDSGATARARKPGVHRGATRRTDSLVTRRLHRADSLAAHHLHHPDSAAVASRTRHPAAHSPAAPSPPALSRAAMPRRTILQPERDSATGLSRRFPTAPPRVLLERSNTLVRTLTVDTREVVLNIYDDGAIDNDTVSVYLDNKMVVNHAMLTDRPIVVTIHLDEDNDYHELVMVADNEGEIPPNTSLMIVKAGDKEYKVNITSSLQKNATVTFKYVKPN